MSMMTFGQGPGKQKYPQIKYYRGDSVVIITLDQSKKIDSTFKSQVSALDSFKTVTDTLVKYKDSVITKYVYTDSVLFITDSLRKELLSYKQKVEEAEKVATSIESEISRLESQRQSNESRLGTMQQQLEKAIKENK